MKSSQFNKVYEQRLIAFVDILGWSEACQTESNRLTAATEAIHDAAFRYCGFIKDEIKKVPNIIINPIYIAVQFAAFSDSFAVSMPANLGCRIIDSAAEICRNLLKIGFLTRGGITVGDLHHVDNVIFGPALIEAVRLEKEAVYPRLVCSPNLIEHLNKSQHKECVHVVVDHLGRRIGNLFDPIAKLVSGQQLNYREIFGVPAMEKIIEEEINKHSKKKSDKKAEKWRYMRDVLQIMLNSVQKAYN